MQKGNETPRPEQPENPEVRNPVAQVPEELTRVTRYRAPDPIVTNPESAEALKPYTSVKCAKEAKEVFISNFFLNNKSCDPQFLEIICN